MMPSFTTRRSRCCQGILYSADRGVWRDEDVHVQMSDRGKGRDVEPHLGLVRELCGMIRRLWNVGLSGRARR